MSGFSRVIIRSETSNEETYQNLIYRNDAGILQTPNTPSVYGITTTFGTTKYAFFFLLYCTTKTQYDRYLDDLSDIVPNNTFTGTSNVLGQFNLGIPQANIITETINITDLKPDITTAEISTIKIKEVFFSLMLKMMNIINANTNGTHFSWNIYDQTRILAGIFTTSYDVFYGISYNNAGDGNVPAFARFGANYTLNANNDLIRIDISRSAAGGVDNYKLTARCKNISGEILDNIFMRFVSVHSNPINNDQQTENNERVRIHIAARDRNNNTINGGINRTELRDGQGGVTLETNRNDTDRYIIISRATGEMSVSVRSNYNYNEVNCSFGSAQTRSYDGWLSLYNITEPYRNYREIQNEIWVPNEIIDITSAQLINSNNTGVDIFLKAVFSNIQYGDTYGINQLSNLTVTTTATPSTGLTIIGPRILNAIPDRNYSITYRDNFGALITKTIRTARIENGLITIIQSHYIYVSSLNPVRFYKKIAKNWISELYNYENSFSGDQNLYAKSFFSPYVFALTQTILLQIKSTFSASELSCMLISQSNNKKAVINPVLISNNINIPVGYSNVNNIVYDTGNGENREAFYFTEGYITNKESIINNDFANITGESRYYFDGGLPTWAVEGARFIYHITDNTGNIIQTVTATIQQIFYDYTNRAQLIITDIEPTSQHTRRHVFVNLNYNRQEYNIFNLSINIQNIRLKTNPQDNAEVGEEIINNDFLNIEISGSGVDTMRSENILIKTTNRENFKDYILIQYRNSINTDIYYPQNTYFSFWLRVKTMWLTPEINKNNEDTDTEAIITDVLNKDILNIKTDLYPDYIANNISKILTNDTIIINGLNFVLSSDISIEKIEGRNNLVILSFAMKRTNITNQGEVSIGDRLLTDRELLDIGNDELLNILS